MSSEREHGPTTSCLGIDFGGVVVPGADGRTGWLSPGAPIAVESVPGAIQSIRSLCGVFSGNVWIVSKASPATEERSRASLKYVDFFTETGLATDNVAFVRERPDKLTACREHRITHFVDDQIRNLTLLAAFVPHLYLFGEGNDAHDVPEGVVSVSDWAVAEDAIQCSVCGLGHG